jgi:glutathione S-transferase
MFLVALLMTSFLFLFLLLLFRLLLEDGKIEYKYHTVPYPIPEEVKAKLPTGQIPILTETVHGKQLTLFESIPIFTHLARSHGND